MKTPHLCSCDYYSSGYHYSWCENTPIYAQLVKDFGGKPSFFWPHHPTPKPRPCK